MIYSVTATGQFGFAIASSKDEALAFSCDSKSATVLSSSPLKESESFSLALTATESDSNPAITSFNPTIASSLTATSPAIASNVVSFNASNAEISVLALSNSACKFAFTLELFDIIINKTTTRMKYIQPAGLPIKFLIFSNIILLYSTIMGYYKNNIIGVPKPYITKYTKNTKRTKKFLLAVTA